MRSERWRFWSCELPTADLAAQRAFYAEVLGLAVQDDDAGGFAASVGASRLVFAPSAAPVGPYHFAFNIPESQFASAKAWLAARTPLLHDDAGADQFFSENWQADMFYFADPAGNILELIARHTLPGDAAAPADAPSLLCISEIGIATDDVAATVAALCAALGIAEYRGPGSQTFAAVGDERGLFIVVRHGRAWFPTADARALLWPAVLTVRDGAGQVRAVQSAAGEISVA